VATYWGVDFWDGVPDPLVQGDVEMAAGTLHRAMHVNLRDAFGREVSLSDRVPAPGSSEDDPAHVTGEVEVSGRVTSRPDLSRFPDGRLPVNTGLVIPAPIPPLPFPEIPKPRSLDFERDKVDVSGSEVEVSGRVTVRPDLSKFDGGRMPVDTGLVIPPQIVPPPAPTPPRFPESFDLGEATEAMLRDLWDSMIAKMRVRTRAGWVDVAGEIGGPLFALGGHPDVRPLEWVFTTAQTNQILLAGTPGIAWRVVMAKATTKSSTSVAVDCRVGFVPAGATALAALSNNSLTGIPGIVISESGIAAGSGVVLGNGSAVIATSGSGDSLYITCGAATSGALRVQVSMYPVPA
jgi:hypothetical protein